MCLVTISSRFIISVLNQGCHPMDVRLCGVDKRCVLADDIFIDFMNFFLIFCSICFAWVSVKFRHVVLYINLAFDTAVAKYSIDSGSSEKWFIIDAFCSISAAMLSDMAVRFGFGDHVFPRYLIPVFRAVTLT